MAVVEVLAVVRPVVEVVPLKWSSRDRPRAHAAALKVLLERHALGYPQWAGPRCLSPQSTCDVIVCL